jgi:hypothetical protein
LSTVPWELYLAAHTRQVLNPSPSDPSDPHHAHRGTSAVALKRNELFSLALCLAVPFIGASLLHYAKGLLSDPERYINKMMIGLFCIASGVRPLGNGIELLKKSESGGFLVIFASLNTSSLKGDDRIRNSVPNSLSFDLSSQTLSTTRPWSTTLPPRFTSSVGELRNSRRI